MFVKFTEPIDGITFKVFPFSWCVCSENETVIVFGFGRKADAEIALKVLAKTGVPFDGPREDAESPWQEIGGRKGAMKLIGESLQW